MLRPRRVRTSVLVFGWPSNASASDEAELGGRVRHLAFKFVHDPLPGLAAGHFSAAIGPSGLAV